MEKQRKEKKPRKNGSSGSLFNRKGQPQLRQTVKHCQFCKEGKEPKYTEYETLTYFITDRGKIISRARSGVCARHQRKLTKEVKRARHLALLPFIVKPL